MNEQQLRRLTERFRTWLASLSFEQLAALEDNFTNVMDDAALDRIDSWIIADKTIAEIRKGQQP